jgi:hypothetical protein
VSAPAFGPAIRTSTRGLARTGTAAMPSSANKAMWSGRSRVPGGIAGSPRRDCSPWRITPSPGARLSSAAPSQPSGSSTASVPGGRAAPATIGAAASAIGL